jgi:hypothetical protein
MTALTLAERLEDAIGRIERIVHLDTMTINASHDLTEWLLEDCRSFLVAEFEWEEEDCGDPHEELLELISIKRKSGWIVQGAVPVMTLLGDGPACSFSWGHYLVDQFYAQTYEAAIEKVIAWAESNLSAAKTS